MRNREEGSPLNALRTLLEQSHLNEFDAPTFKRLAAEAHLTVTRCAMPSIAGNGAGRVCGAALSRLPPIGYYCVTYTLIEIRCAT